MRVSPLTDKDADSNVHVMTNHRTGNVKDHTEEVEMPPAVTIMEPILRFLQLLCENHNRDLQVTLTPINRIYHPHPPVWVSSVTPHPCRTI